MGDVLGAMAARKLHGSFNLESVVGSLGTIGMVARAEFLLFIAVPLFMDAKRRLQS